MDAYLAYLGKHAVLTAFVFWFGRSLQRTIAAGSEDRRLHGQYVFWWALGAFAVGGPMGPFLVGADLPNGAMGFSMFCLLGGWLIGTLHGAVALDSRRSAPTKSDAPLADHRDPPAPDG